MRAGNTGKEMIDSGEWARIGSKHYRHETGVEITYNHNAYGWAVSTRPGVVWKTLWVARYEAEKVAA